MQEIECLSGINKREKVWDIGFGKKLIKDEKLRECLQADKL